MPRPLNSHPGLRFGCVSGKQRTEHMSEQQDCGRWQSASSTRRAPGCASACRCYGPGHCYLLTLVPCSSSCLNSQRQLPVWYVMLARRVDTTWLISTFTPCSAGEHAGGPSRKHWSRGRLGNTQVQLLLAASALTSPKKPASACPRFDDGPRVMPASDMVVA